MGAAVYTYLPDVTLADHQFYGPQLGLFFSGVGCVLLMFAPLITPIDYQYVPAPQKLKAVILDNRGVYAAISLCGVSFCGVSWYMVLYGLDNGMDLGRASTLLSMFMLGGICVDPVFSLLGEKLDRRYILVFCCLICCILVIFLPVTIYYVLPSYALVFAWGGVISAMYSCALMLLEEKLGEQSQLLGHSAFSMMENVGAFIGLILIGAILSWFGTDGFGYLIIAVNLLYFTYALHLFLKGKAREEAMQTGLGKDA